MIHHERACGKCPTRAHAVDLCHVTVTRLLKRRLVVPALNRWLQIWRVVTVLLLLVHVHQLFVTCYLADEGLERQDRAHPEDEADDAQAEAAGAAAEDAQKHFRRQQRVRAKKARDFIASTELSFKLLLWATIARQCMRLHYHLFNHKLSREPGRNGGGLINFCNVRNGIAIQVLELLTKSLDPSTAEHRTFWHLLIDNLGAFGEWCTEHKEMARKAVLTLVGNIWRRLVHQFEPYPWRLGLLVDKRVSLAMRQEVAQAFLDTPACCLDPWFSAVLRNMISSVDDLLTGAVHDMLLHIFTDACIVTTHVENIFAHVRKLALKALRPLHVAQVASNHMLTESKRVHTQWVEKAIFDLPVAQEKKCRPVWAQTKRRRIGCPVRSDGYRLFFGQEVIASGLGGYGALTTAVQVRIREAWDNLPDEAREKFERDASMQRVQSRVFEESQDSLRVFVEASESRESLETTTLADSPWGLADEEYAVSVTEMEKHAASKAFVSSTYASWRQHTANLIDASPQFPEVVSRRVACFERWPCCCTDLGPQKLEDGISIIRALEALIAPRGTNRGIAQKLLAITATMPQPESVDPLYFYSLSALKAPFTCEFIKCKGPSEFALPFLVVQNVKDSHGHRIFDIVDEKQVASDIMEHFKTGSLVQFHAMEVECGAFDNMWVTQVEKVDMARVYAQIVADQTVASALKAVKAISAAVSSHVLVRRPPLKVTRVASGRGRGGRAGTGRGRGRGRKPKPDDAPRRRKEVLSVGGVEGELDEDGHAVLKESDDEEEESQDSGTEEWAAASAAERVTERKVALLAAKLIHEDDIDSLQPADVAGEPDLYVLRSKKTVKVYDIARPAFLGKLEYQLRGTTVAASVQVQCKNKGHTRCTKWANLSSLIIGGEAFCIAWLCMQFRPDCADSATHLALWEHTCRPVPVDAPGSASYSSAAAA